jgi:anti-anti-sigma regulatory factor
VLRITPVKISHDGSLTLRLEGQLIDTWVKELETACAQACSDSQALVLDLGGVSFIDDRGLAFLKRLSQTVKMENPSPFVAELLKGAWQ